MDGQWWQVTVHNDGRISYKRSGKIFEMAVNIQIIEIYYKNKIKMSIKTQQEYQFECNIQTLQLQFQIYENKQSTARLDEQKLKYFEKKIKQLKNIFDRMNERMRINIKNQRYNEYQIKNKLKKYVDNFQRIKQRYKKFQDRIVTEQKNKLMANKNLDAIQLNQITKQANNRDRAIKISQEMDEIYHISTDANLQLKGHGDTLREMQGDISDFGHELTLTDQLMKVIRNRDLVTKLVLILLVFFLGLADLLILFVKILGFFLFIGESTGISYFLVKISEYVYKRYINNSVIKYFEKQMIKMKQEQMRENKRNKNN